MGLLEESYLERPLRIIRLSFSGELAYEIYAGASVGDEVWSRLIEAGTPFSQKPYGVEALGALRLEKGQVAGPEIDGRTTLDDLGLSRMAGKRSGYVGRKSKSLARRSTAGRRSTTSGSAAWRASAAAM
ncbi:hypothetical protein X753_32005 [Mesorhizobium sp. LNJC399B00]|nr:aminomethyltransferase family protein [Mesorhizobium sp. LNJC399B00]ESX97740.1 hypothetical protein X753_32005 [Mesorhizobium sp. LNJC399B00]